MKIRLCTVYQMSCHDRNVVDKLVSCISLIYGGHCGVSLVSLSSEALLYDGL